MKNQMKIPLAKPYIGEEEVTEVTKVVKSGWLSIGPYLKKFEEETAKFAGTKYAIAVNSGTSGLHLCVKAAGIKQGDEVITSPFSFIASSNPIIFEGGKPVFVDVDEKTYNMRPELIEEAITEKTKAILPVHIFGQSCEMDEIMKIAEEHDLKVIEDACESIGATYKGKKVGTFGESAVFAFYPNKQMTTGEGGVIVTDSEKVTKLSRSYRNQGRGEVEEWLDHVRIGYNFRMDEMSAAVGTVQMKRLPWMIKERQRIAETYNKKLGKIDGVITPYTAPHNTNTWFVYTIRVDEGINRDKAMEYLNKNGVASKPYFPSLHLQPIYKELLPYKEGDFPVSEAISKSILALPFFITLTNEEIEYVTEKVGEAVNSASKK